MGIRSEAPLCFVAAASESDHLTKGEIMTDTTWAIVRDSWWPDRDDSFDTVWTG